RLLVQERADDEGAVRTEPTAVEDRVERKSRPGHERRELHPPAARGPRAERGAPPVVHGRRDRVPRPEPAERAECPPPPAHLDACAPVELEGLERMRVEAVGVGDRHRNAVARRAEAPWVPVERRAARRQLLPGPLEAEREEVVREAAALVAPPAELPRVGE